jgi:hypothetical protein
MALVLGCTKSHREGATLIANASSIIQTCVGKGKCEIGFKEMERGLSKR